MNTIKVRTSERRDFKTCRQKVMTAIHYKRFIAKIDFSGECWLWTASTFWDGYGQFNVYGMKRAHRLAYSLWVGDPTGFMACHTCDTPRCLYPGHLFLGTHQVNMDDAVSKGRMNQGVNNASAKLTDELVRQIRSEYKYREVGCYQLAEKFGVGHMQIWGIVTGRIWTHVS